MRLRVIGILIGFGLLTGTAASALACAIHDQQAAAAQQQTADARTDTVRAQ